MSSWQSRSGTENWTDWISGGTSGRAEDMVEGEGKNRGKRKSTEARTIRAGWVTDFAGSSVKMRRASEGQIAKMNYSLHITLHLNKHAKCLVSILQLMSTES